MMIFFFFFVIFDALPQVATEEILLAHLECDRHKVYPITSHFIIKACLLFPNASYGLFGVQGNCQHMMCPESLISSQLFESINNINKIIAKKWCKTPDWGFYSYLRLHS